MRTVLVSNASSGGSDDECLEAIRAVLSDLGEVSHASASSLDAFAGEVREATEGAGLVAVAGGDGTFNLTINALSDRLEETSFGLIPMGTGNDLARTLELPNDPVAAARLVVEASERTIDVGRATGAGATKLFVNACMGGFPVDVNEQVNPGLKKKVGPMAFWVAGAKAAADMTRARVTVNGDDIADCVAIGVGNGQTCGGGVRVWPGADPADGLLNVCALPASSGPAALKLAAKLKAGSHEEIPEVRTGAAARIEIRSEPPIEFNVDGELVGLESPVTFELVARMRMRCVSSR